jgi:hypothetical protein
VIINVQEVNNEKISRIYLDPILVTISIIGLLTMIGVTNFQVAAKSP